jgi:hypothetical protein
MASSYIRIRVAVTQIMKLRYLAPAIQEQILFLMSIQGLNERNLRPVVSRINWRAIKILHPQEQAWMGRNQSPAWTSVETARARDILPIPGSPGSNW